VAKVRNRTFYREVEVSVDIAEVLAEASDEELQQELTDRDKRRVAPADLETIYEEFSRRGDAPRCLRDYLYEKIGRILP